jgi:hypothetical protein
MTKGISENGSWLIDDVNTSEHCFDESLSKAIIEFISKNKYQTLYDLGCGLGNYVSEIKKSGFVIEGYDGNPYTETLTNGLCKVLDLSKPQKFEMRDCTISLEVGEHIPKEFEDIYINNLCESSENLILSWAIEGQGGYGHVNCRNNDWVIWMMKQWGYGYNKKNSEYFRDASTLSWFKDTIMVFKKMI